MLGELKEIGEKLDIIQRLLPAYLGKIKQRRLQGRDEKGQERQDLNELYETYPELDIGKAKSRALSLPKTTEGNIAFLKLAKKLEESGSFGDADYEVFLDEYEKRFEEQGHLTEPPVFKKQAPKIDRTEISKEKYNRTFAYESRAEKEKREKEDIKTERKGIKPKNLAKAVTLGMVLGTALGILLYKYKNQQEDSARLHSRLESKVGKIEYATSALSTMLDARLGGIESKIEDNAEKIESIGKQLMRHASNPSNESNKTVEVAHTINTDIQINGQSCTSSQLEAYLQDNASQEVRERSLLLHVWYGTKFNIDPVFTAAVMKVRSELGRDQEAKQFQNLFRISENGKLKAFSHYEDSIQYFFKILSKSRNLASIGILEDEKPDIKRVMQEIQHYGNEK